MSSTAPSNSATSERIVAGRFSGLAIDGFDPVAYFTDGKPVAGDPAFEVMTAGTVWRFRNDSNRAFFQASPDIYGPAFGGYDPIDVARGVAVAGDPRLWAIAGQRLYLFGRQSTRDAFIANAEKFAEAADARWPRLQSDLAQ